MSFYTKLTIILACAALLIALVLFYFWYENNVIRVVRYQAKMPAGFRGYRIAQVSDLHDHRFGKRQKRLMRRIEAEKPDIIVVTGDLIHNEYTEAALQFVERAVKICPVYYVSGNHECILPFIGAFTDRLRALGVRVLDNKKTALMRGGDKITLLGLSDPMSHTNAGGPKGRRKAASVILDSMLDADDGFRLLLTHRPEMFDAYLETDLVLAGHAHGGQVRLPFVGALITPGEGFKPKYDVGLFTQGRTTMIVSGGLGSSNIVPRVNNRPQLVIVEGE